MNKLLLILVFVCCSSIVWGQEATSSEEQQLENTAAENEQTPEDDSYWQRLLQYRRHPLNLNTATADELKELEFLNAIQLENFLKYRRLLGQLVSVYELQAVPAWDVGLIEKITPYVTVIEKRSLTDKITKRFIGGSQQWLFRYAQSIEKSKEFKTIDTGKNYYLGGRGHLFFRYRYQYKNLLQYGLVGEKDAGEQWGKGAQKAGFDFYSAHLFIKKTGVIQSLALGDFTVNLGQGLVQWQSLSFKKSSDVLNIKRQGAILRPYNSSGEINFHRGVGISLQKKNWELTVFASRKKVSASFFSDSATGKEYLINFLERGYHRTFSEITGKNKATQTVVGAAIFYKSTRGAIGVYALQHQFSLPMQQQSEAYKRYSFTGNRLQNAGVSYDYTWKNMHFFGEVAVDGRLSKAMVNGALISLHSRADLSLLYRAIDKSYQSKNSNAFTENVTASNEEGWWVGLQLRPFKLIRFAAYADVFHFPWLKYRVSAPVNGKDYLLQLTYKPNKQLECYTRYKNENKAINRMVGNSAIPLVQSQTRQNWRMHINWQISRLVLLRARTEAVWYNKKESNAEQGFLGYTEVFYRLPKANVQLNMRIQYFESDGFNARVYAYESDVLYSYSIPAFYSTGWRFYINMHSNKISWWKKGPQLQGWLRWGQFVYTNEKNRAGANEMQCFLKLEVKGQLIIDF